MLLTRLYSEVHGSGWLLNLIALCVVLSSVSTAAFGQNANANITGVVTDSSG